MRKWLLAGAAIMLGGLGIWLGVATWFGGPSQRVKPPVASNTILDEAQGASNIVTVDVGADQSVLAGSTPMAQRVAVIGLLNKRNGASRDLTLKPGEAMRVGDVVIRLRACEQTAPWEQERYTGAFVQLDVQQRGGKWSRVFSGWLYKERPGLNVVQHPIYDVWTKSCAMSFPSGGAETLVVPKVATRSSAQKSPSDADPPTDTAPVGAPNAPSTAPATADDSSPR